MKRPFEARFFRRVEVPEVTPIFRQLAAGVAH